MTEPIHAYLVANARYHDTDFARLELLKLLSEDREIRTRVADSFADTEAISQSDFPCMARTPSSTSRPKACNALEAIRRSWRR